MMSKTRREFAPEYKREAVAVLEGSGRPLTQVAGELGIQPSMLRAWRRVMQGGDAGPRLRARLEGVTTPSGPSPADLASQNAKLKRELDRTRMERDVLKKAIGIFAEVPR
jgi:transposase